MAEKPARRTGLKPAPGKVRAVRSQARHLPFSAPFLILNAGIHDLPHRVMTRHTGSDKRPQLLRAGLSVLVFFSLHGQDPSEFISTDIPV